MIHIPKKIYLQHYDEDGNSLYPGDEITWCIDRIYETDAVYVAESELTGLREQLVVAGELADALEAVLAVCMTFKAREEDAAVDALAAWKEISKRAEPSEENRKGE